MNPKRAKEIAASPVMANVIYNGVPIYIESITTNDAMAVIHPISEPNSRQKVVVSTLIEK
jgi:small acid-soluble spore protein H (minor)